MSNKENICYVYNQLPGAFEWLPCASLKVKALGAGAFQGIFTYGKRYLARDSVFELDPYHLKLTDKPMQFTELKGIRGALRDASPDTCGRRVIQARFEREVAKISEIEYLRNGHDDSYEHNDIQRLYRAGRVRRAWQHLRWPSSRHSRHHQLPWETVMELRAEFELVVNDYLADCKQQGIDPKKPPFGKLLLRVPSEVHGRALIAAQAAAGRSLSQSATEVLRHAAQTSV